MELVAYSTVALTLGLVVTRPRLTERIRITPAMAATAGVVVMMLLGIVRLEHLGRAARNLWSPFVAISAIMVMTDVAYRVGLLELWANQVDAAARSASRLFAMVFALGVVTSTTLNNDAAILLLTPLVVTLIRRRFPERPELLVPFAFAVFVSAGVAPFPISNPMNMVVAQFTGIRFNNYALHMLPIAAVCWVLGFAILRWIFRGALAPRSTPAVRPERQAANREQKQMIALLFAVLLSYPILGLLGGPAWAVAAGGALLALGLARHHGESPLAVIVEGISWDTLAFLLAVLIMSMGLFAVGLVDRLTALYGDSDIWTVGTISAVGSALLNNHPMSHLNMLALEATGAPDIGVMAALVGGDLGPRLLPMGSLAGLLWIELLRRRAVVISLRAFVGIGLVLTIPTLAVALGILSLY